MLLSCKYTSGLSVMLVVILLSCRSVDRFNTMSNIEKIRLGMVRTEVLEILGEPDKEHEYVKNGRAYRRLTYVHPFINASTDPDVVVCQESNVVVSITLDDNRYVREDGDPCSESMSWGYPIRMRYLVQELDTSNDSLAMDLSVKLAECMIKSGSSFYEMFAATKGIFDEWLDILAGHVFNNSGSRSSDELQRLFELRQSVLRTNAAYLAHADFGSMARKLQKALSRPPN